MVDDAAWFRNQLQASGDALVWAFEQLPEARRLEPPPAPEYLGEWPPVRHIWHLAQYERCLALPSMRLWLGGALPRDEDMWDESDAGWLAACQSAVPDVVGQFRAARDAQVAVLQELTGIDWTAPRPTPWEEQPLRMILTKTLQHTFEHADVLLRMGLWWDDILRRQARL